MTDTGCPLNNCTYISIGRDVEEDSRGGGTEVDMDVRKGLLLSSMIVNLSSSAFWWLVSRYEMSAVALSFSDPY